MEAIVPARGSTAGGEPLLLKGRFAPNAIVLFDGVPVPLRTASPTALALVTPPHAVGLVWVIVKQTDHQASEPVRFEYIAPAPAPRLTLLSAARGSTSGQDELTLTGTGFSPGAAITFGGRRAWVLELTETSAVLLTPPHAEGRVDVTITNPDGQSSQLSASYTFAPPSSGGCVVSGRTGDPMAVFLLSFLYLYLRNNGRARRTNRGAACHNRHARFGDHSRSRRCVGHPSERCASSSSPFSVLRRLPE